MVVAVDLQPGGRFTNEEVGVRVPRAAKRMLRPLVVRRRFHAFGVGTGKSGTTSLAEIFASNYRAAHEPAALDLIWHLREYTSGSLSYRDWHKYLERRDRRLWLEMESSQLLVEMLEVLVARYPESRFVLTIRDPYSWVVSAMGHELTRTIGPEWRWWADYRYRREGPVPVEEAGLLERGLYPLDAYLRYWVHHNERVLAVVPSSRLLVLRTDEISSSLPSLAEFLDVPVSSLDVTGSRAGTAVERLDLRSIIDTDYVASAVQERCGPLMRRFFPELR